MPLSETRSQTITRILTQRILSGALAPGVRLRQEHIAAEFATSHVPVREAFRELQALGLARSEPRRGFRVTEFDVAELREVAEMRACLESLALRHAAPRITGEILRQAREISSKGDCATTVQEWEAANRAFHRIILAPCHMPRLLDTIDQLQMASARFLFATWQKGWVARSDRDHLIILDALAKRQTDLACATLARHVGWIGKRKFSRKNASDTESYEIPG